MYILASDATYELLLGDERAEQICEILTVARGMICAPPHMLFEVFQLVKLNYDENRIGIDEFQETALKLEGLPHRALKASALVSDIARVSSDITELGRSPLAESDLLYAAAAKNQEASVVTTNPAFAARLSGYVSVILLDLVERV